MSGIWKTETSHSSNQRAETQRLRNKYPLGNPLQSLTCSNTKLNKPNSYLYFDQIYCQDLTFWKYIVKSLLFAKLHNISNKQICELLLVATGAHVWDARVCLTCKYFPGSVRVSYCVLLGPTVSYVSYCVLLCDLLFQCTCFSQFCVWQCHKSSTCT